MLKTICFIFAEDESQSDEGSTTTKCLETKEVPIEQHEQSQQDNDGAIEKEDNRLLKV